MDALLQQALRQSEAARKTTVPWTADNPFPQPYWGFDGGRGHWVAHKASSSLSSSSSSSPPPSPTPSSVPITHLAVLSWNIDFMVPFARARMAAALATVRARLATLPAATAAIVFLQECVGSDLVQIAAADWVRAGYWLTDTDARHWGSGLYGTTTLVDRRLRVDGRCARVHYGATRMQRDALVVDVALPPPPPPAAGSIRRVRTVNTHLESLALEPPYRPAQMARVAALLRGDNDDADDGGPTKTTLTGGFAAGDFNAIQPFDRTLHADHGLRDAFLERGGAEDTAPAYTWGPQAAMAQRDRFGCSRMDKVYYGDGEGGGLRLTGFGRFGEGVELPADAAPEDGKDGETMRRELVALGFERPWITDHYGVWAEFEVRGHEGIAVL